MEEIDTGRGSMNWRQLQEARGKSPQCSMEELLAKGASNS
jgi:hypothetical protein